MKTRVEAHDLSKNLQQRIGETIAREVAIMRHVLTTGEISIALLEAAVSVTLTAAATVAATMEKDSEEAFDKTLAAIAAMAASDRTRSLEQVQARRSEAA